MSGISSQTGTLILALSLSELVFLVCSIYLFHLTTGTPGCPGRPVAIPGTEIGREESETERS